MSSTFSIPGNNSKTWRTQISWSDPLFWRKLRYFLPAPTAKGITKEGGAELDVSGLWTFTSIDEDQPNATPVTSSSFPAPPVRKQPHQCSTHYLAGAPPSSSFSSQHQRASSNDGGQRSTTRSCGTNVSSPSHHQRSKSANLAAGNDSRQRVESLLLNAVSSAKLPAPTEADEPPRPPPKVRLKNSFYNLQHLQQVQQREPSADTIYSSPVPRSSLLQHLMAAGAPMPPNTPRLPPVGQAAPDQQNQRPPQDPLPQSSLAMIPLRMASSSSPVHARSVSLLETPKRLHHLSGGHQSPMLARVAATECGSGLYARHGRSSSNASTATGGTPRQILHHRSTSGIARTPSMAAGAKTSSSGNMTASQLLLSRPPPHLPCIGADRSRLESGAMGKYGSSVLSHQHHYKSAANLNSVGGRAGVQHSRSSSTPHEGFVL